MGFLLPGNANNPAVEELRRGLALELHLPVDGETADPATFRDFLAAIFPSTQTNWPEIRYEQTLNFLRAWCAPIAYERGNKYRERTAPFINLLREQQTPILPEQVNNGVVTAALPLPKVDTEGRLRDGRGIFWRRKTERENATANTVGMSLADTGIDGLAVTEWAKLQEGDKALLGLLDFNIGEIAHRLRIRIEALVSGTGVIQEESLPFRPDAVPRFISGLLLRSEQVALERIPPLGFLSASGANADNLSRMLLPVLGGGWRIGREVMLPDAVPDIHLMVGSEWDGASLLDIERLKTLCGLADATQVRQLAMALGAWPCLLLRQMGDAWVLPFELAALESSNQREAFYKAFVSAWAVWQQAGPSIAEQVAHKLRHAAYPWLPLELEYNTSKNHHAKPMEVLLVNVRDRTRQPFLLKKVARDEAELVVLRALGVVSMTDADSDKLLAILAFMGRGSPSDEALRGRYRNLILELARREWPLPFEESRKKLNALPLLVSIKNTRCWFSAEQAGKTWFVPRTSQHLRTWFRDACIFLDFDVDTPAPWVEQILGARRFSPKLQMGSGAPETPDSIPPSPCLETRERLQAAHLADLMLIAEAASVGGGVRNREMLVAEWRRLIFRREERVWVKATLGSEQCLIGAEIDRFDVLLDDSEGRLEIWHDIPMDEIDKHLHLFAEPLSSGVFGNRLLADAFAAYMGAGERQKGWLVDRYGISEDERIAMRGYLAHEFLAGETLDQLVQSLLALPEWNGRDIDADVLRLRWWDVTFYIENQLALDADGLRAHLPRHLTDWFPYLEPAIINKRLWEQSFDKDQLHKAVLTSLLDSGIHFSESAASERLDTLCAWPEVISRFNFDAQQEQRERIHQLFGDDLNYLEWCKQQEKSLNWLSAERIFAGEIQDIAVLAAPFSSSGTSNATISTISQTATRRVKRTSQTEREQETRSNQRAGLTAEHRVVLTSARNLLENPDKLAQWNDVLRVWKVVQDEFDSLADLPAYCPDAPHNLVHALHVAANIGDGLGFDVIEVGNAPGEVWLTEVKSATGGRLFLSENERLKALRYENVFPGRWRLKVWLGEGRWADGELTLAVLDAFKDIESRLSGNAGFRPEGWVFQLRCT